MRLLLGLFAVVTCGSCWGCRPPPDTSCAPAGGCDDDEYCAFGAGYEFMENGNPTPVPGFVSDRYECEPMPERCHDEPTCDCLACTGEFACDDPEACDCDESIGGTCEDTPDGPFVQYPHE